MNSDDIVYLSLLLFSIGFGEVYRKIDDVKTRKRVGTIVGLFIVFVVSGFHIIHPLVAFAINALIIKNVDRRICHKASLLFSFLYLFFFRTTVYFGIPYPPAHTNLIQMILTLKMVGLAFEINKSNGDKKDAQADGYGNIDPSIADMFHYCFSYIGVLTGPYYRYTTFRDSLCAPFSRYADNWAFTFEKLKYVPLFAILFVASSMAWPLSYALSDEFYNERSWLYRYWYIWPNFFTFRMRIYIGIVLSECVCTMGGLGVYPEACKPKPGEGPTENFSRIKEISENKEQLSVEKYNCEAIKNINPYGSDFCVTYREGMKHWNICVQYWLAVYIYKNCPWKQYRTQITLLISAVWHGIYTGYYVCIGTVPFVLIIEDLWVDLLLKNQDENNEKKRLGSVAIWFFKMHFFSYQAIAMHLLEVNKILHYYNSIYHAGLIIGIILYGLGLYLSKGRPKVKKSTEQRELEKVK